MIPGEDLARVANAHRRFLAAIAGLTDADVRRPSQLPDWTKAHVVTHVARNADSHQRRVAAAAEGRMVDQYAGGYAGRAVEIDAGAGRPAAELIEDVRTSALGTEAAWQALPREAWGNRSRDVGGRERPLSELPARRWQELEVHLVDLGIGVTHRDWSDDFVHAWLPSLRRGMAARLPTGVGSPNVPMLDARDELAWLYGRLRREGLPELAPWG